MTKLFALAVILFVALAACAAMTLENCKCWDDYQASQDTEGKVSCQGKIASATQLCNLPKPPRCICTEDKITGVFEAREGTSCTQSEGGQVIKTWPCENIFDWGDYRIKYADYEREFLASK